MSDHLLQGREGINIRRGKMKNPLHEKMVEQKRIEENRAETISLVSLVLKILENLVTQNVKDLVMMYINEISW